MNPPVKNTLFAMITILLVALTLSVAAFPSAHAINLANTTLKSNTSNTSVTFTGIGVDAVNWTAQNTSVWLINATINRGGSTVMSLLLNFTTPNSTTDSALFPQVTSVGANNITVTNGLSSGVSAVVNLSTAGVTPYNPRLTYPNGSSHTVAYSYSGGLLVFTDTIASGANIVTLDTSRATLGQCTNFSVVERSMFVMGLIALIVLLTWTYISTIGLENLGAFVAFIIGETVFITIIGVVIGGLC